MELEALPATELRYCTQVGDEVVTTLAEVDVAAVCQGIPVREFSWHRRQGNYPGWLWTATTDSMVGYESLLERDRVLLADFDTSVTRIVSQPFWIAGPVGADTSKRRRHAPDYLFTTSADSVVVVDVKPARMCLEPKVSAVLEWTGRLCRARGWRYEVFHGADPVLMTNLRFLAQGRRSMFLDEQWVAAVAAAAAPGMTLAQIEDQVRGLDPLDVRACSIALLWRQQWLMDLRQPLSSRSVITTIKEGDGPCPLAS